MSANHDEEQKNGIVVVYLGLDILHIQKKKYIYKSRWLLFTSLPKMVLLNEKQFWRISPNK
jgi:hypothetical protein